MQARKVPSLLLTKNNPAPTVEDGVICQGCISPCSPSSSRTRRRIACLARELQGGSRLYCCSVVVVNVHVAYWKPLWSHHIGAGTFEMSAHGGRAERKQVERQYGIWTPAHHLAWCPIRGLNHGDLGQKGELEEEMTWNCRWVVGR